MAGEDAKYQSWVEPAAALERAIKKYGTKPTATEALGNRLRDGLLLSVARNTRTKPRDTPEQANQYLILPANVWERVQGGWLVQSLWVTGQLDVWFDHGNTRFSCHGVRFDPVGLDEFLGPAPVAPAPAVASPPTPELVSKHGGGAPSKDFWPDLWIAIAAQLYLGDLKPKKQAELEEAMSAWATLKGKNVGESTIRRHAAKLWKIIEK